VRAKRDTIDIHEDRVLAVMDDEAIANTTRHHVGIGTAIRDRDLWYQGARQDGRNKRTTRGGKSQAVVAASVAAVLTRTRTFRS